MFCIKSYILWVGLTNYFMSQSGSGKLPLNLASIVILGSEFTGLMNIFYCVTSPEVVELPILYCACIRGSKIVVFLFFS
jgi:hypothetical protein